MNWTSFTTYGDGYNQAFETLCNHLFERKLRREYKEKLLKFNVINGAGGDGGIEAYGLLDNGNIIAIQAKWFRQTLGPSEISQIRKSVTTAMDLRPQITEYLICVPRAVSSLKFGRGKKGLSKQPIQNHEEKTVDLFTDEMEQLYPKLSISWWFEQDIESQIMYEENEGIHKFWFQGEVVSFQRLVKQFNLEKASWLHDRYIPELNGKGVIYDNIQQLLYNKSFRDRLCKKLESNLSTLQMVDRLLTKFIDNLDNSPLFRDQLQDILMMTREDLSTANQLVKSISAGDNTIVIPASKQKKIERETLEAFERMPESNKYMSKKPLLDALVKVNEIDVANIFTSVVTEANQNGKIFLGDAGTGKTQGMSHTVETQLQSKSPAIIIRAKGTPSQNWTSVLSNSLDLIGWDTYQILTALDTLAIRNNHRFVGSLKAGTSSTEDTKIVICIDGLEEDIKHWPEWHDLINQSIVLMKDFPRLKFVFTARSYFLNKNKLACSEGFEVIELPREGDVRILDVIDHYFSKEHYNISIEPRTLIRGIDSLYALRLFCELYKNQRLTAADDIKVVEKALLKLKVGRVSDEFSVLHDSAGGARRPVIDALQVIADCFYSDALISHEVLFQRLNDKVGHYLGAQKIDILIKYLSDNGFLIKSERPIEDDILGDVAVVYELPYQSIMERIMADKYARAIANGELAGIPPFLLEKAVFEDDSEHNVHVLVSRKIVQNIISTMFEDYGKLIGENGFLTAGLDEEQIFSLKIEALIKAPLEHAVRYKESIVSLFLKDYKSRYSIFKNLILPAAAQPGSFFGAEFLHEILMKEPNAFSRDMIWLGWDAFQISNLDGRDQNNYPLYNLQVAINPNGIDEVISLSPLALHNEMPLLYGWSLSTLDQNLRHNLRIGLMKWAIEQPDEFVLLLEKLFRCNDPQIKEDLASIALGVTTKIKDKTTIKNLALWTIQNVFKNWNIHRSVIIRQGFRGIVEKAFANGLIGEDLVVLARPRIVLDDEPLILDVDALQISKEQIYPIVHDLAWYVVKGAYEDFYSIGYNPGENSARGTFLKMRMGTSKVDLAPHRWAMAAAISYIKSLGFNREKGNGMTQASHGSKSEIFTLEEKYTWLAVHYIKGYLSDHLPLDKDGESLEDYSQIVDIPNPAEYVKSQMDADFQPHWVIPENLVPEAKSTINFDEQISNEIAKEPNLNFERWISYPMSDFSQELEDRNLIALYNYTSLVDSQQYFKTGIEIHACIIKKGDSALIRNMLLTRRDILGTAQHIDELYSSPKTEIYSNPSDIVWMHWIGEREHSAIYFNNEGDEKNMYYGIAKVTHNSPEGEKEVFIPSKLVRELVGIASMDGNYFIGRSGNIVGFTNAITGVNYQKQEILLLEKDTLLEQLDKNNYELVWFVEHLSRKNPLNPSIESSVYQQKCRKYFIYNENGEIKNIKYWDDKYSN
ncbi:hypothetical protein CFS9_26750 [Flavobacterium sp. CFS9]|uniref:Restriction endonuclease n=1 Tax=Flavobacterium sp. CFS9 TaxID=3143118 RepID=A0AAT9H3I6_9FLAO